MEEGQLVKMSIFFNYSSCSVALAMGGESPHYTGFELPSMRPSEQKQKILHIRDKVVQVKYITKKIGHIIFLT